MQISQSIPPNKTGNLRCTPFANIALHLRFNVYENKYAVTKREKKNVRRKLIRYEPEISYKFSTNNVGENNFPPSSKISYNPPSSSFEMYLANQP